MEYGGWERTLLSGWGRVQEGGDWSRNLKRARLPIVTDQECTRNVSGHITVLLQTPVLTALSQLFQFTSSLADLPYFPFKIYAGQLCAGKTTPTKKGGCQVSCDWWSWSRDPGEL